MVGVAVGRGDVRHELIERSCRVGSRVLASNRAPAENTVGLKLLGFEVAEAIVPRCGKVVFRSQCSGGSEPDCGERARDAGGLVLCWILYCNSGLAHAQISPSSGRGLGCGEPRPRMDHYIPGAESALFWPPVCSTVIQWTPPFPPWKDLASGA